MLRKIRFPTVGGDVGNPKNLSELPAATCKLDCGFSVHATDVSTAAKQHAQIFLHEGDERFARLQRIMYIYSYALPTPGSNQESKDDPNDSQLDRRDGT